MAQVDNTLRNIVTYANSESISKTKSKYHNKSEEDLEDNEYYKVLKEAKNKQYYDKNNNIKKDSNEYLLESSEQPIAKFYIPETLAYPVNKSPLAVLKPYKKPLIRYFTDGHIGHRLVGAYATLDDLGKKIEDNIIQPVKNKFDNIFVQPIRNTLDRLDERGEEYIDNFKSDRRQY